MASLLKRGETSFVRRQHNAEKGFATGQILMKFCKSGQKKLANYSENLTRCKRWLLIRFLFAIGIDKLHIAFAIDFQIA